MGVGWGADGGGPGEAGLVGGGSERLCFSGRWEERVLSVLSALVLRSLRLPADPVPLTGVPRWDGGLVGVR